MVACAVAMGAGTMGGGVRIIKTMGTKIIELKPVDGLIAEITLESDVNQTFPSGPEVIAIGSRLAMGAAKELMAWVVGLISPILFVLFSVNQRLPSGPAAMP